MVGVGSSNHCDSTISYVPYTKGRYNDRTRAQRNIMLDPSTCCCLHTLFDNNNNKNNKITIINDTANSHRQLEHHRD